MSKKLLYLLLIIVLLTLTADSAQAWTKTIGFEDGTPGTKAEGTADSFGEAGTDSLFSNAYSIEGSQSCNFHFTECVGIWGKAHAYFGYPSTVGYGGEMWARCYIYQKSPWSNGYCGPYTCGYWKFFRIHRKRSDNSHRGYTSIIGQASGPFFMSNEACPVATIHQNVGSPYTLTEDQWECTEFYVKFHETEGIIRMWINGELKVEQTNFQTSYVGDSADWTYIYTTWNDLPPQDQDSYMDAIVVTTDTPSQQDSYGNPMIGLIGGPIPPGQASNPSPANSATDVSVNADLSWNAGSGATSHDVYFGTDSTPDSGEFQGNQTATTFEPGTMSNSTTYYWRIDEVNAQGTTTGNIWNFTTESGATPPGQASNPSPADSATAISIDADLSWTAGSGSTSSDVYFGTDSTPDAGEFQGNQTATTYEPGTMSYSTTYYWRIDEINAQGTTTGNVWSFTTEAAPPLPGQASNPSPADSATDVSIAADLSWTAGSNSTSHDVYFGTSSPGTFQGNQTAVTFDPGTMDNDTTYYWRIDEINTSGTTTGIVWSFTTVTAGGPVTEEFGDAANTDHPGTIEDIYTNVGAPTTNHSTSIQLCVYTWPADTVANTTIIKWDLSAIPTDATVTEATLYLYQFEAVGDASYDVPVHKIINVNPVISALNWNTYDGTNSWTAGADGGQGDTAAAEDTQALDNTINEYKTWNVTNMVADWVAAPSGNYGMLLNSDSVASVDSHRYFVSTDDTDPSKRPKLIVTYSAGATPPGQASNPSPADTATNVSINADLSWTAGSGADSHDVYFGTSSPGAFQGNQTAATFDTGSMSNDTTYYWRIDEVNTAGTTTGVVWNFTTIVAVPGQASNPSPADSATDVSIDADLSWTASSGATSHDVYFGTTSPGTFQGNQTETTYDPGTMANDTTYYWRIDEVNAAGTTTGVVWSFTTESAPLALPWTDGFESGDLVTGGWTTSGNASASNKAEYTGTYGAQLKGTAWMEKAISTTGFTAIHVKYLRKTKGLDSGEYLYVEYHDGTQWNELEATQATSWASQDKTCGSGADNNAGFKIRFRTNASNANEYAYIDDVEITGTAQ